MNINLAFRYFCFGLIGYILLLSDLFVASSVRDGHESQSHSWGHLTFSWL